MRKWFRHCFARRSRLVLCTLRGLRVEVRPSTGSAKRGSSSLVMLEGGAFVLWSRWRWITAARNICVLIVLEWYIRFLLCLCVGGLRAGAWLSTWSHVRRHVDCPRRPRAPGFARMICRSYILCKGLHGCHKESQKIWLIV